MLFCSYLGLMALVLMLCALPFLTGKGYYIFQTFDDWSGSLPLVVIALFQCIAVAWVYGNDKYVLIDSSLSFLSNIISYFSVQHSKIISYLSKYLECAMPCTYIKGMTSFACHFCAISYIDFNCS